MMKMMKGIKKDDGRIAVARLGVLDLLEDLGSAATLLREALRDAEEGNVAGAKLCADDVVTLMAAIESRASEIGAGLMKWVNAEGLAAAKPLPALGGSEIRISD